jgi:hypothetical protein
MRARREHLIAACPSLGGDSSRSFAEIASQLKQSFDHKILIADTPMPERDIVLTISFSDPNGITAMLLERIFGFAFDKDLFIEGGGIRMRAVTLLNGLLGRVSRDNRLLEYYGIKIVIFVGDLAEEACVQLFSFMLDWCKRIEADLEYKVTFDLAANYFDFRYILENEHRRMVHGDIKAQYAYRTLAA